LSGKPEDRDRALQALKEAGYQTKIPFPHWLAKVFDQAPQPTLFIDLIYDSGNGVSRVDDEWFALAIEAKVLGVPARLKPPEENIWSKAFVMERERFDGADVAHLIHHAGETMNRARLVRRFGEHWRVLLAHL
jgi:hypothetical protein